MEHVQPFDRPFPWRAATLVAVLLALVELAALLALAGVRLLPARHAAAGTGPATTRPEPGTGRVPKEHPLRARSRVSVLVLNGNGIAHAAGAEATRMAGRGYRRTGAANAPSHAYARSLVLFRPGWEREARRLARDAGIRTVTPLDGRLSRSEAGYQLVLVLGAN